MSSLLPGVQFIYYTPLWLSGERVTNPPMAAGDFRYSVDGAAFVNLSPLPTVTPAGDNQIKIVLSAVQTADVVDSITLQWHDPDGAWEDDGIIVKVDDTWSQSTRTLTMTAAEVEAAVQGDDLLIRRDVTWNATLTGLTFSPTRDNVLFTVKTVQDRDNSVPDSQSALVQLGENEGLIYLNNDPAATPADGSLGISGTSATFALAFAAVSNLQGRVDLAYDLKQIEGATRTLIAEGRLEIKPVVTRT